MERTVYLPRINVDTQKGVFLNEVRVNNLNSILSERPFVDTKGIVSIFDLDGVLCEHGHKNNFEANVSRLRSMKAIIAKSDEFVIWSSRINIKDNSAVGRILVPMFGKNSITMFPFITDKSIDRLEGFAQKSNPDCVVSSKIGLRKMRSCIKADEDFFDLTKTTLEQDKKLVMVGSCAIDRQIMKQVATETQAVGLDTKNIYFFNTGHLIF